MIFLLTLESFRNYANNATKPTAKSFCWWGLWVGVAFFSIYPTTNWLAESSTRHYSVHLAVELNIPFLSGFIWFYLSMYLLLHYPILS